MSAAALLTENPLIVKHCRSRLRGQQLGPAMVGVVVVAILILWGAIASRSLQAGGGFVTLLFLQGAILFLGGSSQVAASVAHARDSGILDFHRISPQSPRSLALGFLIGGAVREWILFGCTLPFSLLCAVLGPPGILGWLLILLDMVVVALLYHAMAVVAGLVSPKTKGANSSVVGIILMLHWLFVGFGPGLLTIVPTVRDVMDWGRFGLPAPTFFGAPSGELLLSLLHQIPLLIFIFIAAERRMRHERAYFYPKPLAVGFLGIVGLLTLGDVLHSPTLIRAGGERFAGPVVVGTLVVAGLLLITAVTPNAGDFANGVRRARKRERRGAPPWSDLASNWTAALAFCGVLLVTCLAAVVLGGSEVSPSRTIAAAFVGACVLLYFASGKQAFDLMYRKSGAGYFTLFIFLIWLVPLAAGMLAGASGLGDAVSQALMGLSPLAGIPLVAGAIENSQLPVGAGASISTSLGLAIAMITLRQRAERHATAAAVASWE